MVECSVCKAVNDDKSLYCLECGQRLIPKIPNPRSTANILPTVESEPINVSNSGRLHSPLLDMGSDPVVERPIVSKKDSTFGFIEQNKPLGNAPRHNAISHNGLHSPLLDGGQNRLINPYPEANEEEPETAEIIRNKDSRNEKTRLHSPVLDGPGGNIVPDYEARPYNEQEDYESLRSPLLQSKVPLPEKSEPERPEPPKNRLGSLLGPATGQTNQPGRLPADHPFNITGSHETTQSKPPGFGQSFAQSNLGQSNIGQTNFGQANLEQGNIGQTTFGQSNFGQSHVTAEGLAKNLSGQPGQNMAVPNNLVPEGINQNSRVQNNLINSVNQNVPVANNLGQVSPGAFSQTNLPDEAKQNEGYVPPLSITGINKINQANQAAQQAQLRGRGEKLSSSRSFLPADADEDLSAQQFEKSKPRLNKMVLMPPLFLALAFKIWYLLSLGSAAFGSVAFVSDQIGQIIIIILILVIVLA